MKKFLIVTASLPVAAGLGLATFAAATARRAARLAPPAGRMVGAGRASLHVVDEGTGPPIVLIHGLAGNLLHWRHGVTARLVDRYRTVSFDRPGCGHSTRRRGASAGLREEAAIAAALIGRLGLERPLVVGHSMGGAIALALAIEHPDRVGGLALVSPLVLPEARVPAVFRPLLVRPAAFRLLLAWTVAVSVALRWRKAATARLFGPETPPPDFATVGGGVLATRPSNFVAASADLAALGRGGTDLVGRFGAVSVPVGVLAGTADRILATAQQAERLPDYVAGATVELVEGAGHMLPLTQPALVADFVRRMAERVATEGDGQAIRD